MSKILFQEKELIKLEEILMSRIRIHFIRDLAPLNNGMVVKHWLEIQIYVDKLTHSSQIFASLKH